MRRALVLLVCLSLVYLSVSPAGSLAAAADRRRAAPPAPYGITIANWSPRAIREIYVSPATAPDWGQERLNGRQVPVLDDVWLAYGGGCRADVRVVFDNEGAEERRGLDLCRHAFIGVRPGWTTSDDLAGAMPTGFALIRNRSGRVISQLYLFAEGEDEGRDRLGTDLLPDGLDIDVLLPSVGRCDFSLRAAFLGDAEERRYAGIDLCHSREVTIEPRMTVK